MKQAVADFSTNIARSFTKQFLDIAMAPMQEQVFGQMKRLFGVTSAQEKAELAMKGLTTSQTDLKVKVEDATAAIRDLTGTLRAGPGQGIPNIQQGSAAGLVGQGGPDAFWAPNNNPRKGANNQLNVVTPGQATLADLTSLDVGSLDSVLSEAFAGIGESLTQLGKVADTTGKQTGDAAKSGEQGFGKFLGAMTGVATGALAITGAIQAMQDSEGGTYGTLMGIAGVLGGLGSIFGGVAGLGKKASGGPVSARRPYIVGEIGPELFVPEGNGTIIPNDKIAFTGGPGAGSSTEANGMTVPFQQGSSSSVSNAFSTLYGASIPFTKSTERVLAERSERETVSAINNPKPLDVRFESQVINNVTYVTAEQHQRGMAQAAERGRALTLEALQNSVTSRRKVGIN